MRGVNPHSPSRRALAALQAIAATALLFGLVTAAAARDVTDAAGRKVTIPDRIARVVAAGPPASVLVVMLAPEKLAGWNVKPRDAELPFLPAVVRGLPEIGRLTGRGGTANLETIMAAKPDPSCARQIEGLITFEAHPVSFRKRHSLSPRAGSGSG